MEAQNQALQFSEPPRSENSLHPTDRAILAILRDCAAAGDTLPSNRDIADRLGLRSVSSPSMAITRLYREGYISVEAYASARKVVLLDTGETILSDKWPKPQMPSGRLPPAAKSNGLPSRSIRAFTAHTAEKARIDTLRSEEPRPCARCGVRGKYHERYGCRSYLGGV